MIEHQGNIFNLCIVNLGIHDEFDIRTEWKILFVIGTDNDNFSSPGFGLNCCSQSKNAYPEQDKNKKFVKTDSWLYLH